MLVSDRYTFIILLPHLDDYPAHNEFPEELETGDSCGHITNRNPGTS